MIPNKYIDILIYLCYPSLWLAWRFSPSPPRQKTTALSTQFQLVHFQQVAHSLHKPTLSKSAQHLFLSIACALFTKQWGVVPIRFIQKPLPPRPPRLQCSTLLPRSFALLQKSETHLSSFQSFAHSLPKTPGVYPNSSQKGNRLALWAPAVSLPLLFQNSRGSFGPSLAIFSSPG